MDTRRKQMTTTQSKRIFDDALAQARRLHGEQIPQRVTERLLGVFYAGTSDRAAEIVRTALA